MGSSGSGREPKSVTREKKANTLICPHCREELVIPANNMQQLRDGIRLTCPECGQIISIKS